MLSTEEFIQLFQSLIWLLAGVGVFIVGMNFMSDALEKCAGSGMNECLRKSATTDSRVLALVQA